MHKLNVTNMSHFNFAIPERTGEDNIRFIVNFHSTLLRGPGYDNVMLPKWWVWPLQAAIRPIALSVEAIDVNVKTV